MITLSKIQHNNADQILIQWSRESHREVFEKVNKIPGLKFTRTHGGWYLPCHARSYDIIKKLGFKIKIQGQKTGTAYNEKPKGDNTGQKPSAIHKQVSPHDAGTTIIYNNDHFRVRFTYDEKIVAQIKKLARSYWHSKHRCWVVKANQFNLIELQQIFNYWNPETFEGLKNLISAVEFPREVILYPIPESVKYIAVKLVGYQIDVAFIKSLSNRTYQKNFSRWLIPAHRPTIQRVIDHYQAQDTIVTNRLPGNLDTYYHWEKDHSEKQQSLLKKYDEKLTSELRAYTDVMISQRYSWATIKAYTSSIVRFIYYLGSFPIRQGTAQDVNRFIATIASKNVSYTEINRHCSAIKFYYEKVRYRPDFEIDKIKRPRGTKTIPKVLSKKQVSLMFGSLKNLKHLTMLYMLYNGGLRSGELIKLRLQDIQWDRSQVFIEGGKGKKDRIVMLGDVMKNMLQEYVEEYRPSYWLFEGQQKNTPYSANSLNQIVKRAAKHAGITQKVTTHTLRHCFATHLLESGTNIRLIQELLGHNDIKTTLVYTHISKMSVAAVQSPLDTLSFEKVEKSTQNQ